MVTLAVRTFGQQPVTCNARSLLYRAHADLERGALYSAGCLMREAVRVYLVAECTYWDCLPEGKKQRSCTCLLKSLMACKELKNYCSAWLEEIIDYGNKLAHCQFVRPSLVSTSLEMLHMYLDYAKHLQQPAAAGRLS